MLLFLIASGAGLGIAYVAVQGLTQFFAIGRNPVLLDIHYDWKLAAFAIGVALTAGLITGLWPAIRALRIDPQSAMKESNSRLTGRRSAFAGTLLIIAQVAFSMVLLTGAVMFGRTMVNLNALDLGFKPGHIVTMSLDPVLPGDTTGEARELFWRRVLRQARELPGVRSASLSPLTPLSGRDDTKLITVVGSAPESKLDRAVHINHISEDYFKVFGIAFRGGRGFTEADSKRATKVTVLNETAAKAYFGSRSPIGETLRFGDSDVYQVVGIVADHRQATVRDEDVRLAFVPLWQPLDQFLRISLAVSSDQPVSSLALSLASQVRAVQPNTLVSDVIDVETQIDAMLVSERLMSTLAIVFAGLAIGLSAIGLYGILSYSAAGRRTEFGIRIALGASRSGVAWSVLRSVALQLTAGVCIGLPVALWAAHAEAGLLYKVLPSDPGNYLLSMVVLAVVAGLSAYLPTRCACSIDPAQTLRRT